MSMVKPTLYTSLSPKLLHLYDVSSSIVVIIDVLRATSTIATALYNGANNIIPVDSVAECIRIGRQIEGITAGKGTDISQKASSMAIPLLNIRKNLLVGEHLF
jgi:2-phosphosulfolactate phosphatase